MVGRGAILIKSFTDHDKTNTDFKKDLSEMEEKCYKRLIRKT